MIRVTQGRGVHSNGTLCYQGQACGECSRCTCMHCVVSSNCHKGVDGLFCRVQGCCIKGRTHKPFRIALFPQLMDLHEHARGRFLHTYSLLDVREWCVLGQAQPGSGS